MTLQVNQLVGFGVGTASSGNDIFTKLLLHCDGANNSTTFTDSSASNFTVTPNSGAKITTAVAEFGSGSCVLNGTSDYLTLVDNVALQMGAGDFTIDWWLRSSVLQFAQIISKGFTGAGGLYVQQGNTGAVNVGFGGTDIFGTVSGAFAADGLLHHYALARSGTAVDFYHDGVSIANATNSTNLNNAGTLFIGATSGPTNFFGGWIDEFRISKGVARWTTNFTPPTAPYS